MYVVLKVYCKCIVVDFIENVLPKVFSSAKGLL